MTTIPSAKKDQTKSASKLFSGVSAAALIMGLGAVTARAAGTTITNTITSFSVTSGSSLDFIDIDGGTITGDLTNNGTVGLTTNAIGIQIQNGGAVSGQIVNNTSAIIQASGTGIAVQGAPAANLGGGINNLGNINVALSGAGASVFGINVAGSSVTTTIANGGTIAVNITGPTTGTANGSAIGINVASTGPVQGSVSNTGLIDVDARFDSSGNTQTANAAGVVISNSVASNSAGASLVNSGIIDVDAFARETCCGTAHAFATAVGASLVVNGTTAATNVAVAVTNSTSGVISVNATAFAGTVNNSATAFANPRGVVQTAAGGLNVSASLTNNGLIDVQGQATAVATSGSAWGSVNPLGIGQFLTASNGATNLSANFVNSSSGVFRIKGDVNAVGTANATAVFTDFSGLVQRVTTNGTTNISLGITNSGLIDFDIMANASGNVAGASAGGHLAIAQTVHGLAFPDGPSTIDFTNNSSGSILVNMDAAAIGGASATADAGMRGIVQSGEGEASENLISFSNAGTISFEANGNASASGTAWGKGHVTGLDQRARDGGVTNISANNNGSFNILVSASAQGGNSARGNLGINGVFQSVSATSLGSANVSFANSTSGSFNLTGNLQAIGTGSATNASAFGDVEGVRQGLRITSISTGNFAFTNSGNFNVEINVSASGGIASNTATASAVGYIVRAGTGGQTANLNVVNSGTLNVKAVANASNAVANATGLRFTINVLDGTVVNSGTLNVTASAPGGSAKAIGIAFNSSNNGVNLTNTGSINVLAIGSTTATAVKFTTAGALLGGIPVSKTHVFTNNGGTISAILNNNGTLSHGVAINAQHSPHVFLSPIQINLEGGGSIFGDIKLSEDDSILVRNGSTFFDGQINGTTTLNQFASTTVYGALTVASGGTLTLQVGAVSSEANIYVDTYTQTSTGTLSFNITPATTKLGMIHANVANLNGTVNVNIAPGLYGNSTTFSDVVAASTLNGTWSSVTTNTNSAFLSLAASLPGDGTADLILTRNAFNSLGGLTMNQNAVATGIETSYNVNLTGPYGTMVQELLFMNAATYTAAIEQLHGSEHPQIANSLLYSFNSLNSAISDRVNVGPYRTRGDSGDIIQRGDISFWARASIGFGDNDGDVEAPGFDQDVNAYHAGIDYAAGTDTILGFAAGYYKNELDFTNGNTAQEDGVQLAIYAHHDIRDWYLRGVFGYGLYDGESRRAISVGTIAGTALGMYDVKAISFFGEFGHRIEVNPGVFVTPYGALSYASVKMDAFSETGVGAANLAFPEQKVKAWMGDLGARFSTSVDVGNGGLFIPEFSVAWSHNFGDERVALNTGFSGVSTSNFTVVGSHVSSESILVNAGLTFATAGGIEIKGEYNGRFNSQYKENSFAIRLSLLFGS